MNAASTQRPKRAPHMPFALLVALVLLLGACSGQRQEPVRALYYWSTTFVNDSLKRQFYKAHNVQWIHILYFFVVNKTGH